MGHKRKSKRRTQIDRTMFRFRVDADFTRSKRLHILWQQARDEWIEAADVCFRMIPVPGGGYRAIPRTPPPTSDQARRFHLAEARLKSLTLAMDRIYGSAPSFHKRPAATKFSDRSLDDGGRKISAQGETLGFLLAMRQARSKGVRLAKSGLSDPGCPLLEAAARCLNERVHGK